MQDSNPISDFVYAMMEDPKKLADAIEEIMDEEICDELIDAEARAMAEAVNGGSWDTDYTEAQKAGWRLKVLWAMERYK